MTTVTVTKIQGFGMYPGHCAMHVLRAPWMGTNNIRGFGFGTFHYPKTLMHPEEFHYGGVYPDDVMTYDAWVSGMRDAGISLIYIALTGRTQHWDGNTIAQPGFEIPPYGTFNIWHNVPDPSNLPQYRADQVTHPVNAATRASSNLGQLFTACEEHGMKVWIHLFDYHEIKNESAWSYHAYNTACRYWDGTLAEVADRGMIADKEDFFTDDDCIDAQRARFDFILDEFGDSDVIAGWQIMQELSSLLIYYDFWPGVSNWRDAQWRTNVYDIVAPWLDSFAEYIKNRDPYLRPVTCGETRTDYPDWEWVHETLEYGSMGFWSGLAWPYTSAHLDYVDVHMFDDTTKGFVNLHKQAMTWEGLSPRRVCTTASWPFEEDSDADEEAPFYRGKQLQWVATCLSRFNLSSAEFVGLEEDPINVWRRGGYADPDKWEIAGVCRNYLDSIDWLGDWHDLIELWHDNISGAEIDTPHFSCVAALGDGAHVKAFIKFTGVSSPTTITVGSLDADTYEVHIWDYVNGTLDSTTGGLATVAGEITFNVSPQDYYEYWVAMYIEPE